MSQKRQGTGCSTARSWSGVERLAGMHRCLPAQSCPRRLVRAWGEDAVSQISQVMSQISMWSAYLCLLISGGKPSNTFKHFFGASKSPPISSLLPKMTAAPAIPTSLDVGQHLSHSRANCTAPCTASSSSTQTRALCRPYKVCIMMTEDSCFSFQSLT